VSRFIHNNKNNENINFSSYLAGLFEEDDHISLPNLASKNKVIIAITFHEKDLKLCEHIKCKLGYG
jgi:hypothetical protein